MNKIILFKYSGIITHSLIVLLSGTLSFVITQKAADMLISVFV
jgi:hypothetical protein